MFTTLSTCVVEPITAGTPETQVMAHAFVQSCMFFSGECVLHQLALSTDQTGRAHSSVLTSNSLGSIQYFQ
jgi:hypothetical protein